jgi:hypothetical protein
VALKIVPAAEPIRVEQVVVTIYAVPGVGKTSLGFSADAPLLFDMDRGAYRSGYRKDSVQPVTWDDVAGVTAEDVKPYKTLVMDTAGRGLDLLAADIIRQNPKMGRGGALTLQGYGELKSRFTGFLKLIRGFGLDVVLVAHSDEKMQGDELIERIDMQGASKQEVYKSSDAMARLAFVGGKRVLSFSPTDTSFGKDPAGFGRIEYDLTTKPNFLGDTIRRLKESLNAMSEDQKAAVEAAERRALEWDAQVGLARTAEDFDALIPEAKNATEKRGLVARADGRGFAFDKKAGRFAAKAVAGAA